MSAHNKTKSLLDSYTVEARWQWLLANRMRIDGEISSENLERLKAIFYIGYGEALDMLNIVGNSAASEQECDEFGKRIRDEVVAFHLQFNQGQ